MASQATTIGDKPRQYLQIATATCNHVSTDLQQRKTEISVADGHLYSRDCVSLFITGQIIMGFCNNTLFVLKNSKPI